MLAWCFHDNLPVFKFGSVDWFFGDWVSSTHQGGINQAESAWFFPCEMFDNMSKLQVKAVLMPDGLVGRAMAHLLWICELLSRYGNFLPHPMIHQRPCGLAGHLQFASEHTNHPEDRHDALGLIQFQVGWGFSYRSFADWGRFGCVDWMQKDSTLQLGNSYGGFSCLVRLLTH